jgi:hypothetical protein
MRPLVQVGLLLFTKMNREVHYLQCTSLQSYKSLLTLPKSSLKLFLQFMGRSNVGNSVRDI